MTYITSFPREMMYTEEGDERQHPKPDPEELKEFLAEFGATVATWQLIESRLFVLFQLCLAAKNQPAASASFHSIQSFRGRLEAVNGAFKHARIEQKAKDDWAWLSEKIRKKSLKRNALAHGVVISAPYETKRERRIFIGPNPMDAARYSEDESDRFTVSRLTTLRESLSQLDGKLHVFSSDVFAALGPRAEPT